jgi:NADP-dependent 3-hydroxy acid dehydrogenase YdfG
VSKHSLCIASWLTACRSGLMIAEAFACNGAKVYISGRCLDTLEKAAADVAGRLAKQQVSASASLEHVTEVNSRAASTKAVNLDL